MTIRTSSLLLLMLFIFAACSKPVEQYYKSFGSVEFAITSEQELMLDTIQHQTFQYFLNEFHPQWGIIKDRAADWAPSSIAASGYGMASLAVGVERGWVSREDAANQTLNMLQFYAHAPQTDDTTAVGYKGFYYHFHRLSTGGREWRCELSSVDTGLLMMGVIFARNYYGLDNDVEREIRSLAQFLLERIEWEFMLMPQGGEYARTLSMGWYPETEGLHDMGWKGYNEALFLYILAAGLDMHNVEDSYDAWLSSYNWSDYYPEYPHVLFPPLFGHQFAHSFIDFRGLADSYMRTKGIDYFENSRRATYSQRQYAMDNPHGWVGYDSLCWGVTACDGPDASYNYNGKEFYSYAGRGASNPNLNYFDDGTTAPYGALSSLPFAPEIVIPTIQSMIERNGDKIWGKYGFYDSFNLTLDWVNDDFIGIAQGPTVVMIENFRTGLVWNYVMRDPVIQKGLDRLGFDYL